MADKEERPVISAGSGEYPSLDKPENGSTTDVGANKDLKKLKPTTANTAVMVCGWPERSASMVAQACRLAHFDVLPFGLALQEESGVTFQPQMQVPELDNETIYLVPSSREDTFKERLRGYRESHQNKELIIVVDTSPDAPRRARLYEELGLPFVIRPSSAERAADALMEVKKARKAPAVVIERTSPALGVLDDALLESSRKFPGALQEYQVALRRSSATLDPLLSSKMVDALQDFTLHSLDPKRLFAEASQHPLSSSPATQGESVEEIILENECSLVKITYVRKERASDEEFARVAVRSVKFLIDKVSTGDKSNSTQVENSCGAVFGLSDVLAHPAQA